MDNVLLKELKDNFHGDIETDDKTLMMYSHDASLFEVKPDIVVFPKDIDDIKFLVSFVGKHKKKYPELSLTGRAAGTDMGGGSINQSILVAFGKYFNHTPTLNGNTATTEPGVFYRDFEKETLKKGLIFPSYPASRELCAMGGIVNNNSGGERSLDYGKTEKYVRSVDVVLSDSTTCTIEPQNLEGLKKKMAQNNFEGEIYRGMHKLITDNYDEIMKAKPDVSKNSAGYYLWNVYNKQKNIFDLTKLWVGAQGTLGLMTKATIGLVPTKKYAEMMVIFLHDISHLGKIINEVLPLKPDTFEAYDDNTLKLALRFFPGFAQHLGTKGFISTGIAFLPEFWLVLKGGLPKMVLQIDFQSDSQEELDKKILHLQEKLAPLHPQTRIEHNKKQERKYWLIRRESFNLLRSKFHNKHTAPFVDDFAVKPEYLSEVLPKINALFKQYPSLIYTIAGHVGDGNFHIIPLMKIEDEKQRKIIPELGKKVYDLILKYHGTITAEHNDGIIRTPYLEKMYGKDIVELFRQTKQIFDPQGIFNPGKKVGGTMEFAMSHIRTSWDT